ncbi:MAG: hypothetical protein WBF18_06410, partial [Solirubrobacterales bacterium]
AELDRALPASARGLTAFPLGPAAVGAIAERVVGWLRLPAAEQAASGVALRRTVSRLWSWEGVARGVISASAGELEALVRVPSD